MRQLILDLAWDPLPPFAGFLPGDNAAVVALRHAMHAYRASTFYRA